MKTSSAQGRLTDFDLKLLPHRIEQYAKYQPGMLYTLRSSRVSDWSTYLEPVNYATFAHAIDRAAWWLDDHLHSTETQVFTYHDPQDIRWTILSVAAIKTERTVSEPYTCLCLTSAKTHRCSACQNGSGLRVSFPW